MTAAIEPSTEATAYPPALVALHWITALAFVAVFAAVEFHEYFPKGDPTRDLLMLAHKSLGITILLLVIVRLFVRSRVTAPRIIPLPPAWQTGIAHLTHTLLYAAMLALPLLGWLMSNAAGRPAPFFGLELPYLIGENKDLARPLKEMHELIGNVLYYVIGLHAIAALVHHHVFKDNTLSRMLPVGTRK
ncbi:cytochrome b [Hyphomicrobium sp. 99]|uniref:cytochrome b n=1 Tax=Hyphomicrobium sp. 99 TaxID=1163419 RepID=UPI0005F78313|nr:cytochrome b [Hyphomicrobium sp. 99]